MLLAPHPDILVENDTISVKLTKNILVPSCLLMASSNFFWALFPVYVLTIPLESVNYLTATAIPVGFYGHSSVIYHVTQVVPVFVGPVVVTEYFTYTVNV